MNSATKVFIVFKICCKEMPQNKKASQSVFASYISGTVHGAGNF